MRVVNKRHILEAYTWTKNGSHPDDGNDRFTEGRFIGEKIEGKVVRYFRDPELQGGEICEHCKCTMHEHGLLDDAILTTTVCPGDVIVTMKDGTYRSFSPSIFSGLFVVI